MLLILWIYKNKDQQSILHTSWCSAEFPFSVKRWYSYFKKLFSNLIMETNFLSFSLGLFVWLSRLNNFLEERGGVQKYMMSIVLVNIQNFCERTKYFLGSEKKTNKRTKKKRYFFLNDRYKSYMVGPNLKNQWGFYWISKFFKIFWQKLSFFILTERFLELIFTKRLVCY